MKKTIYLILLLYSMLLVHKTEAQVDVTVRIDMSYQTDLGSNAPQILGSFNSYASGLNMTSVGNNVYEYTFSQLTSSSTGVSGNAITFNLRYWNGTTTIIEQKVPTSCSNMTSFSDQNGNSYRSIPLPATNTTYTFAWNGCGISTYSGSSWDVSPVTNNFLKINNDVTLSSDLATSGIAIASGKKLTVNGNKTLTIDGYTPSVTEVTSLLNEGFESTSIPTITTGVPASAGTVTLSISTEDKYEGTSSLKAVGTAGNENIFILPVTISESGTYTFSFYAKASIGGGFNNQRFRINNDFTQNLQVNPTITATWQKFSGSATLNAGTFMVHFKTANTGAGTYFFDNISVTKSVSGVGTIEVESGSSVITNSDDTHNASFKIHRNKRYADAKYSFVGSPVASPSINGSALGTHSYSYDETVAFGASGLDRWVNASATAITVGKGYAAAGSTQNLVFTGVPNTGTITISNLTHTAPDSNHDEHGWQLVSNPYASAIDVTKFLAKNSTTDQMITNAVYLWDDNGSNTGRGDNGDYLMASTIGTIAGPNGGSFNGYIGSAQGFFVKVSSPRTDATVTFSEDMRSSGNNADANFFRKADAKDTRIKLALSTESGLYNETLIGFREDATVGIDYQYDADKLIGNNNLQFYSLINDSRFGIQGLPLVDGVSTELAFNLGLAENLTLSIVDMNIADAGKTFFLYDAVTKETYNLSEVNSFTFSGVAGSDQNRFTLTYAAANVLSNSLGSSQPIYRYTDGHLNVKFGRVLTVAEYTVYDLSGKVIKQHSLANATTETLNIDIQAKGINIVKIATSEGVFTRKFIF